MTVRFKNILVSFLSLLLGISAGFFTNFQTSTTPWDLKSIISLFFVILIWIGIVSVEFFIVTEAEKALEREKRRSVAREEKQTLEDEIEVEKLKSVLENHKRENDKTLDDL